MAGPDSGLKFNTHREALTYTIAQILQGEAGYDDSDPYVVGGTLAAQLDAVDENTDDRFIPLASDGTVIVDPVTVKNFWHQKLSEIRLSDKMGSYTFSDASFRAIERKIIHEFTLPFRPYASFSTEDLFRELSKVTLDLVGTSEDKVFDLCREIYWHFEGSLDSINDVILKMGDGLNIPTSLPPVYDPMALEIENPWNEAFQTLSPIERLLAWDMSLTSLKKALDILRFGEEKYDPGLGNMLEGFSNAFDFSDVCEDYGNTACVTGGIALGTVAVAGSELSVAGAIAQQGLGWIGAGIAAVQVPVAIGDAIDSGNTLATCDDPQKTTRALESLGEDVGIVTRNIPGVAFAASKISSLPRVTIAFTQSKPAVVSTHADLIVYPGEETTLVPVGAPRALLPAPVVEATPPLDINPTVSPGLPQHASPFTVKPSTTFPAPFENVSWPQVASPSEPVVVARSPIPAPSPASSRWDLPLTKPVAEAWDNPVCDVSAWDDPTTTALVLYRPPATTLVKPPSFANLMWPENPIMAWGAPVVDVESPPTTSTTFWPLTVVNPSDGNFYYPIDDYGGNDDAVYAGGADDPYATCSTDPTNTWLAAGDEEMQAVSPKGEAQTAVLFEKCQAILGNLITSPEGMDPAIYETRLIKTMRWLVWFYLEDFYQIQGALNLRGQPFNEVAISILRELLLKQGIANTVLGQRFEALLNRDRLTFNDITYRLENMPDWADLLFLKPTDPYLDIWNQMAFIISRIPEYATRDSHPPLYTQNGQLVLLHPDYYIGSFLADIWGKVEGEIAEELLDLYGQWVVYNLQREGVASPHWGDIYNGPANHLCLIRNISQGAAEKFATALLTTLREHPHIMPHSYLLSQLIGDDNGPLSNFFIDLCILVFEPNRTLLYNQILRDTTEPNSHTNKNYIWALKEAATTLKRFLPYLTAEQREHLRTSLEQIPPELITRFNANELFALNRLKDALVSTQ